ncbi:MAG: nitrite reductase small subunit NirD [Cellvibrionaceae bacterium]
MWKTICKKEDLTPNTGLCALLNGEQVAVFYSGKEDSLYAVSNFDPFGKANVLSRGLMGSAGEELFVASPLYKQKFNLKTGKCLDDDSVQLKTYAVRLENGEVQLQAA